MDRSICAEKAAELFNKYPAEAKPYIEKILQSTLYIKTDDLITIVRRVFEKVIKDTNYNLFIPREIGSEHMIMLAMEDLFIKYPPAEIIYGLADGCFDDGFAGGADISTNISTNSNTNSNINNTKINNDYPIVIIDDAVYSSHSMCGYADYFEMAGIYNKIYCIVGISSSTRPEVSELFNAVVLAAKYVDKLRICELFPGEYEYMYKTFGCESDQVIPIYFDHKIANEFGSYQFYHKIIKNPVSRHRIDTITENDIDKFIQKIKN